MPIPMHAPASVPARTLIVLMACAVSALAQEPVLLDGKPVRMIANDKVTLAVRSEGGAMVRLVLNDDPAAVNLSMLSLNKDAPIPPAIAVPSDGRVVAIPQVGGLHHQYERQAA